MDSLGFKKSLLPPPPLGYFQTPLGENLNTGEILSFSFNEEKQPFGRLNSENNQEVELPQIQKTEESLTLKEADEPKPNQSLSAPNTNNQTRKTDTPQKRRKNKTNRRI